MVSCPSCSTPAPEGAAYCPRCATRLASGDSLDSPTVDSSHTDTIGFAKSGEELPAATKSSSSDPRVSDPTDTQRFAAGTIFDKRYRIVGLLGRGGMGEVYRADDLKLGQSVALKFLPPALESSPDRLERFLNEVRVARQVTHPHVCRMYDVGEAEGHHYLSMEYVDGEDLSSLLRGVGRLPEERATSVARQLCAGLAAAHSQGILHRDLKPANVMIDGRGDVRITDFGLAALSDRIEGRDISVGTPAYMAPEQLSGQDVSDRSDIYALGLVLYELFTGQAAVQGETLQDIRTQHSQATPVSVSHHVSLLDPAIERVVMHCLEKDPNDRPSSALAVSAALPGGDPLAAALAAGEIPSPELLAQAGESEAWSWPRTLVFALAGLLLAIVTSSWQSTYNLLSYLDLSKPPLAMEDRARDVLKELGYTEPVYSNPGDRAHGYFAWWDQINEIAATDSSENRWERLRDMPDAVGYWYRQSPWTMFPRPTGGPNFAGGGVQMTRPFLSGPGQLTILLNAKGELRRFERMPKRFQPDTLAANPPDWSRLFELANLDMANFVPAHPRYQRFLVPDRRAAWEPREGTNERRRVEAGSVQGRPVLFNVSDPALLVDLTVDPQVPRWGWQDWIGSYLGIFVILGLIVASALFARRNLANGQADRRGAFRIFLFSFVSVVVVEMLRSHAITRPNGFGEIVPIFGTALFDAAFIWLLYLAVEPHGRRLWPSMFVPLSRLIGRTSIHLRDPLIGQSVLVGVIAGGISALLAGPVEFWLQELRAGAPPTPFFPFWGGIVSVRSAAGSVAWNAWTGVASGFVLVALLITARYFVNRPAIAVLLAALGWAAFQALDNGSLIIAAAVFVVVVTTLLRFGILAAIASSVCNNIVHGMATPDWGAWHSLPAKFSALFLVALLVYGAWAATSPSRTTAR